MGVTIRFEQVYKRFGNAVAVRGADYTIERDEFFVLLGPSGAGKTTTLKLVAGIERPSAGEIRFDDRAIGAVPPRRRRARMAFENYSLYPHMNVAENLASPLRALGLDRNEISERVDAIARMLEIDSLLQRLPRRLSGGQKQRVSLGRSLIVESDVFLLDEPLAHLDAKIRNQLRAKFQDLKSFLNHGTVLYVTHDYQEALALADRIGVIVDGTIHQIGTPRDIYDRPVNREVARLLGLPEINLHPMTVSRRNGTTVLRGEGAVFTPSPRIAAAVGRVDRLVVGIRPQYWDARPTRPPRAQTYLEATIDRFEVRNYKGVVRAVAGDFITYVLCRTFRDIRAGAPIWIRPRWDRTLCFHHEDGTLLQAEDRGT